MSRPPLSTLRPEDGLGGPSHEPAPGVLEGHAAAIIGEAISADGSTLYTGSFDGTAIAWDLTGEHGFSRTWRASFSDPSVGAWNVAVSPDEQTVAVGATDGSVNLWDTTSLRRIASFHAIPAPRGSAVVWPGQDVLVMGDSLTEPRAYIRIWSLSPSPSRGRRARRR